MTVVKSPVVLIAFYCQFHRLEVEDGIQRIPFQRSVYTLEHFEIGPGTSLGNMASPAPKPCRSARGRGRSACLLGGPEQVGDTLACLHHEAPGAPYELILRQNYETPKDPKGTTEFRGLAATMNFLSQDWPNIQYANKYVAKYLSNPTNGSWDKLKKLSRCIEGCDRVVWKFPWQSEVK